MHPLPSAAFRAYDIRGIIDQEITPDFMRHLGRAFAVTHNIKEIVVGFDARPSSKEFLPYFLEGLTEQGASVCLLGMVPSELVIATACLNHIDHAAILTASHNPPQYVGIKLFKDGSKQIGMEQGQQIIRDAMANQDYPPAATKGTIREHDPWADYVTYIASFARPSYKPRHIVADAGNGLGGVLLGHLSETFNLSARQLFWEPDGLYPHHVPNPNLPHSREAALQAAKDGSYDFSIVFDGDADRIMFFDEKGDFIPSDFSGTLLADEVIQKKYPGSPVVIDLRRGWTLQDSAERLGYEAVVSKAGTTFMKHAMRESGATYGFEASAHNFYKDFFTSDSSGMTLAFMLNLLEETGKPLSELIAPYTKNHFMIDEQNYVHHDPTTAFNQLTKQFSDAASENTDGLSLTTPTWHANLRPSNTEPFLRLNLETRDKALLEEIQAQFHHNITSSGGHLVDH